jgi:hypothetical protein
MIIFILDECRMMDDAQPPVKFPRFGVFVSSTSQDLKEYRLAARDAILGMEQFPVMMEYWSAMPNPAVNVSLEKLATSEIYVGIFAHRYGYCPPDSSISITEMEYNKAEAFGLPRLCFLVDEEFPWDTEHIEGEPGKSKLQSLKTRINQATVRSTFTTPDKLAAEIMKSLFKVVITMTVSQPLLREQIQPTAPIAPDEVGVEAVEEVQPAPLDEVEVPPVPEPQPDVVDEVDLPPIPEPQEAPEAAADLSGVPLPQLMEQCAEQQQLYRKLGQSDDQVCYELTRRALAEHDEDALAAFYRVYEPLVDSWVRRNPLFAQTGEDAHYFTNVVFSNFYYAANGSKFAEKFVSLAHVLAYMRSIVHSSISQYMRYFNRSGEMTGLEPDEDLVLPDTGGLEHGVNSSALWERIRKLLPNEDDFLLAKAVFQLDQKPAQIAKEYPEKWSNAREVSVALYRIRRLLREDNELQGWLTDTDT